MYIYLKESPSSYCVRSLLFLCVIYSSLYICLFFFFYSRKPFFIEMSFSASVCAYYFFLPFLSFFFFLRRRSCSTFYEFWLLVAIQLFKSKSDLRNVIQTLNLSILNRAEKGPLISFKRYTGYDSGTCRLWVSCSYTEICTILPERGWRILLNAKVRNLTKHCKKIQFVCLRKSEWQEQETDYHRVSIKDKLFISYPSLQFVFAAYALNFIFDTLFILFYFTMHQ